MRATPFDSSLTLSRPFLHQAWQAVVLASRGIAAAAISAWFEAGQRRRAWRRANAVAHLSEHLLRDIGADDGVLAQAAARRTREDQRAIELQRGIGAGFY